MIFKQIWDPNLEPSWPILALCWASWRLLGQLLATLGAFLVPGCSQGPPGASQTPPRPQFSTILHPFLEGFRQFFHCFFEGGGFLDRFFKLQIFSSSAPKIEIGTVAALRAQRTGYPPAPGTGVLDSQCQVPCQVLH